MKIIFDNIVFSLQKSGGISVVWYELTKRFLKDQEMNIQFVDNDELDNPYRGMLNLDGLQLQKDTLLALSRYLSVNVKGSNPFIFHSSYYRYCSNPNAINITTVHDFTYDYYRKGPAKWLHCWQRNRAIRHSDVIVCISENTKNDLLMFLPDIDENRVRIIYNGVSEDYCVLDDNQESPFLPFIKGSFLVFVGNRIGYKNFDLVMKTVSKTRYNLLIVGSTLTKEEEDKLLRHLPKERYYATGFLSNERLNVVYNNAAALVYPSSYEGFGIPVIEAQKAGCPVIAYNGSSIPEIIGETPLLMNELTEEEMLCKIEMLSNSDLRMKVIADGLENAKRFSWDKMYQNYLELYKEVLNSAG